MTFRGHRGWLLVMQFLTMAGPFCRTCGLDAFRRMTVPTAWAGWWGMISPLFTVYALVVNASARSKVAALGMPEAYTEPSKPLLPKRVSRLEGLGFILPVVLIAGIMMIRDRENPANAVAGDCVRNRNESNAWIDEDADIEILDCSDRRATYRVLAHMPGPDRPNACYSHPEASAKVYSKSFILCLETLPGRRRS
ncbi:LppU/SCO3897 family protein [Nocardia huaxiensis]|uniref:Uncharacterized protein n=1 Tax=Nocardia huaxiensis TaxID=2755382 RepID=A0A7D6ZJV1_9NOCA|nr:hypothetical protein [Nocardia huaxiensis]QLY32839.1 hypothetical protein H0264_11845 [Nocardia huaxiensis]UFS93407.1 hypothetical protein LPY97_21500 [Nocardia huaxiensis]